MPVRNFHANRVEIDNNGGSTNNASENLNTTPLPPIDEKTWSLQNDQIVPEAKATGAWPEIIPNKNENNNTNVVVSQQIIFNEQQDDIILID